MPRPHGAHSYPKPTYNYRAVFSNREELIRRHETEGFVFRRKWYQNLGAIRELVRGEGGKVQRGGQS